MKCDRNFVRNNIITRYYCPYHRTHNYKRICSCGNEFDGLLNSVYCNKTITRICQFCNKEFSVKHNIKTDDQRFCSKDCQIAYLHSTYDMKSHNERLWANENYVNKIKQIMSTRIITDEFRQKCKEVQKFTKEALDRYNKIKHLSDNDKYDKWTKFSYGKALKLIGKHNPDRLTLYIFLFENKDYIKVGITFSKRATRVNSWAKRGGRLIYSIIGQPLFIATLEAQIHTKFLRCWQEDFTDGKTEFHYLSDLANIINFIKGAQNE